MKVLVTRPAASDPGGVTAFFDNISKHFDAENIQIEFLEIGSTRGRFLHPISDQFAFRRKIRAGRFDLILINPSLLRKSFFRDGLLALQAKAQGLPLLVFFHGWSDEFSRQVERRWMQFFSATFGRADAFIVLASDFKNKLRQWGVTAPIYRSTTAVDERLIADFDLEKKLAQRPVPDELNVLFLARLEPEKGIYETIDACTLLSSRGVRLNLLIAGDGTEAENIRAYAQAKLADRTQFLGYVRGTAKATVFSSADIYVMPTSYGEGLPVSLLEAMTFGLPVITRPVGGLKDIFIDGQHGFITESTDPEVIAGLIEKLLADPPLWRSICRQTHQFACENFLGSMVAANAAAIFRQVYDTSRISVSSDKNAKTLD